MFIVDKMKECQSTLPEGLIATWNEWEFDSRDEGNMPDMRGLEVSITIESLNANDWVLNTNTGLFEKEGFSPIQRVLFWEDSLI